MQVTFTSSFIPRKCGIATYTRDLSLAITGKGNKFSVVAMENPTIPNSYSSSLVSLINQDKIEDYIKAAEIVNDSPTDIVHIQHEFGLFGGEDGKNIIEFSKRLTKPLITTFHTVLLTPTDHQKYIIQELTRLSRRVTVMEEVVKYRLENVYGLNARDISVIPHGVPTITVKQEEAKKIANYSKAFILLANNLLSRNKGIEYAIEAVAKAVNTIPNLLFLVIGETHPLVKVSEGEVYREELLSLVKKLHLEKHVVFKNEYLSLEKLKMFLAAADIYITPYLDSQQVTSGTLAYAIGADKACIATEYIYAKQMLADGRGVLIPFRDADAIASAIINLYKNPKKRLEMEKKTKELGKDMSWPRIADKHLELYKHVLSEEYNISKSALQFLKKPVDISYLSHLTDSVGIMQHAYHTIPDRKFGYSTDDNARAFIIASQLNAKREKDSSELLKTYLSFLQFVQEPDGRVHTFSNFRRNWEDEADIGDAYGKVMWALGFYLYSNKNSYFTQSIHALFIKGFDQINNINDLRAAAFTILGLYYYLLAYGNKTDQASAVVTHIKKLADFLLENHKKAGDVNWDWFEEKITYDNFRLPQALFAAYMATNDIRYKKTAISTLEFITDSNFDKEKEYYDFIGQNGWYKKGMKREEYDQQPLEAAGAVEAYLFAAKATKKKSYIKKALLTFEWFFGRNRNHRFIYDRETKGVYDGLNLRGVSQNEGAESLVCFLMASLSLKQYLEKAHY